MSARSDRVAAGIGRWFSRALRDQLSSLPDKRLAPIERALDRRDGPALMAALYTSGAVTGEAAGRDAPRRRRAKRVKRDQ